MNMRIYMRAFMRSKKKLLKIQKRPRLRSHMREKTNLTLHPAVKEAALALAEKQGRSLSELVERLLEREIEKTTPAGYGSFFVNEEPAQPIEQYAPSERTKTSYKAKAKIY
jgi:hypothetical protein